MNGNSTTDEMQNEADVVILGSGVAGLTAALTAALEGLQVVVLEHADSIGGTSARSSGTVWVPDNHHLRSFDISGDGRAAETYLANLVGSRGETAIWKAFLDAAPAMIADLERRAAIKFRPYMTAPDYRQDVQGAAEGGRALEPLPYDGRLLGEDFARLAWPIRELMLFAGMMITRGEAATLLRADRSMPALWLGLRLVARFLVDRIGYQRGTRLVLGNALVAALLGAGRARGVSVLTGQKNESLVRDEGRVTGVVCNDGGRRCFQAARCGVVLAGGGFPGGAAWRAAHLPSPVAEYTAAAPECDGSSLDLALSIGAALGPAGHDNAFWFPSSLAERQDGTTAVYPHIVLDRAKPGLIATDKSGRRFVNEAVSYHEFVRAMYRANLESECIPAWLVCDRAFIKRYGLGLIRPRTPSIRNYVASGYLREAPTIADLGRTLGMAAGMLEDTVRRYNEFAAKGKDDDFGKGETIYDRSNGDPAVAPNPCLGAITKPPFYALAVHPTPLGTSRGLLADVHARVCDTAGKPIEGLYVCGNDMQSAFGGEYPGAGAQLGQAMTFAWIAAHHLAQTQKSTGAGRGGRHATN